MRFSIRNFAAAFALVLASVPLHGQGCSWDRERPKRGREAQEDSIFKAINAANRDAILGAAAATGAQEPRGVVVFTMERNGGSPLIRMFDGNIAASVLESVLPGMVERAKRLPQRSPDRVGLFVRLDTIPLPPVRADGKRLECRPSLTNRHIIAAALQDWMQSRISDVRPATVNLDLFLDRDGKVLHTELSRRGTNPDLNRFALDLVPRLVFRAASIDGVPRDAWVTLPISIR